MKIEQIKWDGLSGWTLLKEQKTEFKADLVLAFGNRFTIEDHSRFDEIKAKYPKANILICSTAGEICGSEVFDDSIIVTAISFERTKLKMFSADITSVNMSYETGKSIAGRFPTKSLSHVFVISDGQIVNGSELVRGMNETLPDNVSLTGGLAGDGARFQQTLVGLNEYPAKGKIAAIGFYGKDITIGYGSIGGWDSFGPERLITKSENNILFELDGQSALSLYKNYLGELASGLPGNALLFPLSIKIQEDDEPVVRTILSIDEENQSMTFAGDIPKGAYARLMKANFDRLIDGASQAAQRSAQVSGNSSPDFAILISCIGRKLVLGQRVEEEVESVCEILGKDTVYSGFYSYGEISPFSEPGKCVLHNQTMTITTFSERTLSE